MRVFLVIAITLALVWKLARRSYGRWTPVAMLIAWPVGGLTGLYCGGGICYGILKLQGAGESHNDMFAVAAFSILGLLVGAIALPWIVRHSAEKCQREIDAKTPESKRG